MPLTDSQKELLELFRDANEPILTAADVADAFNISQQAAYARLARLQDCGIIKRKQIGSRAVAWWVKEGQSKCDSS